MDFFDQLHRKIALSKTPLRIISLVPSQSELLADLGLEDKIVGITKFCIHPQHLRKQKTIVGGTKQVKFEKIKALAPDIIICNKEENTKEMVAELEKIAPVWISDITSIADCVDMIQSLGEIFSVEAKGKEIIESIQNELIAFEKTMLEKPVIKSAYLIWKDPYMVAGSDTFINTLLELNKFQNIFSDRKERYPQIQIDELKAADLILLSSEPYPFQQKHIDELVENIGNKKILLVDGEYFSWYGSRLIKAFNYFSNLHKDNSNLHY
jgi:ABC-type Fe3+-hydroxamate transport system substrate-binding protein